MIRYFNLFLFVFSASLAFGQMATLEGYVFENNNRGYLNYVKVEIAEKDGAFKTKAITNQDGFFTCEVPKGSEFTLTATKDVFEFKEMEFATDKKKEKAYVKVEMIREPGYLFEVTMAEKYVEGKEEIDAITGALIEIYNNTADTSVLELKRHPNHTFSHTFEQGNHYTVMIRKEGYFTKRLEAFVNVDGCIMCFEGIDEIQPGQPGIADNLTRGHLMGTLVANVELEEIRVGEAIKVENIYYASGKYEITEVAQKPLDNLIHVLKNNPSLMVELGSHTDSQGNDDSNYALSSKRAQGAVDYILDNSNIRKGRIQARGYGETDLVNGCKNGVKCSDRKHQQNRRTALKIVGIADYDPFADKPLKDIIREEKFEETLTEIQNQDVVQFENGQIPDEVLAQAGGKQKETDSKTKFNRPLPTESVTSAVDNAAMAANEVNIPVGENEPEFNIELNRDLGSSYDKLEETTGEFELISDIDYTLPKKVSTEYSGFLVEFLRSKNKLPNSHLIFKKHGNIKTDLLGDGTISYMMGGFTSKADAEKFLKHIIAPQYSKAKIIVYQKGSRS